MVVKTVQNSLSWPFSCMFCLYQPSWFSPNLHESPCLLFDSKNRYSSQDSVKIIETKMISLAHFVLTALHMVQMTLAYFLMLIVMTYNTWLCLSVIFGSTLGYFLFGWRKTTVVDVSDHCHWHQLLWDVVPKFRHFIFFHQHRLFSKFFKTENLTYPEKLSEVDPKIKVV